MSSAVADLVSLLLLECVMAFGGQQYEPVSVADVLHVRQTATFAIGSLAFTGVDAVFVDQLPVKQSRIFAGLDPTGYIEPVAMS